MGHVLKTEAGTYRANWRDPAGRQKAKTFKTKKEANAYLAEVESAMNHGDYIDPRAGKIRFGTYAERWLSARTVEARTAERTLSLMRTHVLPQWADWPVSRIDHLAVQEWITDLGRTLAPGTVTKCLSVLQMILATAVRSRVIAVNAAEGVKVAGSRKPTNEPATISREAFFGKLLPALPPEHRAIVCTAAGAGLRWGECAGLAWGAVDLEHGRLRVVQVAVETPGAVVVRPYPKSRAGVRSVPLPRFVVDALKTQRRDGELVFPSHTGTPQRRANFRKRVWLPALVRAGLLGAVVQLGEHRYRAVRPDRNGVDQATEFTTEREAVEHVALRAHGGLRFHDLRHSYASWLVTDGVPVNVVQKVMGHEQASFTLNRYTHAPDDYEDRVRAAFSTSADFPLTFDLQAPQGDQEPDDPAVN